MSEKFYKLIKVNQPNQETNIEVKYCDSFLNKGLGLMFKKELKPDEGIILVDKQESRINSGIHMFFMNFDITVLWLDSNMVIIDKVLARKWRPIYLPKKPAQFVVELHRNKMDEYQVGDKLYLER